MVVVRQWRMVSEPTAVNDNIFLKNNKPHRRVNNYNLIVVRRSIDVRRVTFFPLLFNIGSLHVK